MHYNQKGQDIIRETKPKRQYELQNKTDGYSYGV